MIFGRLAIKTGSACIMPSVNVASICTPVASIFGALSLMIPAIFVTICGMYSISSGKLFAIPCASCKIKFRPASISVPAFSRSDSVNCKISGSACASTFGTPSAKPDAKLLIICVAACVMAGACAIIVCMPCCASIPN